MKKTVLVMLSLLVATLMLAALPISGEERIYDDVIRLHVLAASDDAADQEKKLLVRDAVLAEWGDLLADCGSRTEAQARLDGASLAEIRATARQALSDAGDFSDVEVLLSVEEYPTRDYGSFSLPAGEYLSLRIVIGEGEGRNWWCVLFPPLCTAGALQDVPLGLSDAEFSLIRKRDTSVRFKALEVLSSVFKR